MKGLAIADWLPTHPARGGVRSEMASRPLSPQYQHTRRRPPLMSIPADPSTAHPSAGSAALVTSRSLAAIGDTGGPNTPAGKAISARNGTTHGVFSALPVLPGVEREEDWELHRTGF